MHAVLTSAEKVAVTQPIKLPNSHSLNINLHYPSLCATIPMHLRLCSLSSHPLHATMISMLVHQRHSYGELLQSKRIPLFSSLLDEVSIVMCFLKVR